jgi:hypothetical protein
MNPPVKLSELVEALDLEMEDYQTYLDRKTGTMVTIQSSLISALEEDDDESLQDLDDWDEEEAEVAKAIVQDDGTRFIPGPDKFDFDEYREMERFIRSLDDEDAADQLWRAIKGRGAFRYFKDTLHRLGIQDDWYAFRDEAMKRFVIDWADVNNIAYVDDGKKP